MTRAQFQDCLRRLRCIDRHELRAAKVVMDDQAWRTFRGDPIKWLVVVASDADADAVFRLLTTPPRSL